MVSGKKKSVKCLPLMVTCTAGLVLSLTSFTALFCACKENVAANKKATTRKLNLFIGVIYSINVLRIEWKA
jgi:hypothetical protein